MKVPRAVNSAEYGSRSPRENIIVATVDRCFVLGKNLYYFCSLFLLSWVRLDSRQLLPYILLNLPKMALKEGQCLPVEDLTVTL